MAVQTLDWLRNDPGRQTGIYIPSDWGRIWKPKRNLAVGSGKAVVHCVGSSISQGFYASVLRDKGYVGVLRTAVQAAYGDGGSGYHPAADSIPVMTGIGLAAGVITAYTSQFWTLTNGNWVATNVEDNYNSGPVGAFLNSTNVQNAVVSIPNVRGTTLTVYTSSFPSTSATVSQWTVKVNGTAVGTTTTPNLAASPIAVYKQSFNHGVTGTYTVELDATGGLNSWGVIYGVSGENATGVVVNRLALGGFPSKGYAQPRSGTVNNFEIADWSGGQQWPCDLLIFDMSVPNDLAFNGDPDAWFDNMRFMLHRVKDYSSSALGATDIILLFHHVGQVEATLPGSAHSFYMRARDLAEAYGAVLFNVWGMYRNSYGYANSLSFWGKNDASGAAGTDTIHPSDIGHLLIALGDVNHLGLKDLVLAA